MRIVFDTYALMAYFNREASYEQVYRLITETLQGQHEAYISIINLGELFYIRYRKNSPAHAERGAFQFRGELCRLRLKAAG